MHNYTYITDTVSNLHTYILVIRIY